MIDRETVNWGGRSVNFFILEFFPRKFGESCTRLRRQEREEGAEGVFYNMPSGVRGGGSQGNIQAKATGPPACRFIAKDFIYFLAAMPAQDREVVVILREARASKRGKNAQNHTNNARAFLKKVCYLISCRFLPPVVKFSPFLFQRKLRTLQLNDEKGDFGVDHTVRYVDIRSLHSI